MAGWHDAFIHDERIVTDKLQNYQVLILTNYLSPTFMHILFDVNFCNSDLIEAFVFYTQCLEAVVCSNWWYFLHLFSRF